jgi:hypothetical protein
MSPRATQRPGAGKPPVMDGPAPRWGESGLAECLFFRRRAAKICVNILQGQINQMGFGRGLGRGRGCGHLGDLMRHNVDLGLGNMVLNHRDLLVHGWFLVMDDRLRLVFRHWFLVLTCARMWEARSRARGRRWCG